MKRLSLHVDNESGFYLPIVLVVTILVFSFLTMIIAIYKNDVDMTKSMIQQMEIDTLTQMVREDFSHDVVDFIEFSGTTIYEYPNGQVIVDYERENESTWMLDCSIQLQRAEDNIILSTSLPVTVDPFGSIP